MKNKRFLYSYVTLDYNQETEVHGITGDSYIGGLRVLDNGTLYPETACFSQKNNVQKSGVRNVSKCKFNAPAFVSYPHFYLADPWYRQNIVGMKPDRVKHELNLTLEANTGIPLHVDAKLQLNLRIEPMQHIK